MVVRSSVASVGGKVERLANKDLARTCFAYRYPVLEKLCAYLPMYLCIAITLMYYFGLMGSRGIVDVQASKQDARHPSFFLLVPRTVRSTQTGSVRSI